MNPTNVGAIFRSAAALGIDAVLLTQACSDPLYRRAIRVSMGTVFQVPWTYLPEGWPQTLRALGFTTAAMALCDASLPIYAPQLKRADRLAVVLGTEGDGLAESTIAACDCTVRIPMTHGGVLPACAARGTFRNGRLTLQVKSSAERFGAVYCVQSGSERGEQGCMNGADRSSRSSMRSTAASAATTTQRSRCVRFRARWATRSITPRGNSARSPGCSCATICAGGGWRLPCARCATASAAFSASRSTMAFPRMRRSHAPLRTPTASHPARTAPRRGPWSCAPRSTRLTATFLV